MCNQASLKFYPRLPWERRKPAVYSHLPGTTPLFLVQQISLQKLLIKEQFPFFSAIISNIYICAWIMHSKIKQPPPLMQNSLKTVLIFAGHDWWAFPRDLCDWCADVCVCSLNTLICRDHSPHLAPITHNPSFFQSILWSFTEQLKSV